MCLCESENVFSTTTDRWYLKQAHPLDPLLTHIHTHTHRHTHKDTHMVIMLPEQNYHHTNTSLVDGSMGQRVNKAEQGLTAGRVGLVQGPGSVPSTRGRCRVDPA